MKTLRIGALVALVVLATTSVMAQSPTPTEQSKPAASTLAEARADWIAANIKYDKSWRIYSRSAEKIVLWEAGEKKSGPIRTFLRLEYFEPRIADGRTWRSAAVMIDADCKDPFSFRDSDGRLKEGFATAKVTGAKLMTYPEQNLRGEGRFVPPPAKDIFTSDIQFAVNDICGLVWAPLRDVKGEVPDAESYQKPVVEAWADKNLTPGKWKNRTYLLGEVMYVGDASGSPNKMTVKVRSEYVIPQVQWNHLARSTETTYQINCERGVFNTLNADYFARHNLKEKINYTSFKIDAPMSADPRLVALKPLVCPTGTASNPPPRP